MGREKGQAAVESALVLPLQLFLMLGIVQLGLMLAGRLTAELAVYRATRAGSIRHGDCAAMADAALAALLPSFHPFLGRGGAAEPERAFATALQGFKRAGYRYEGGAVAPQRGDIFWLERERPTLAELEARGPRAVAGREDVDFDDPTLPPVELEVSLVYWFPLEVPFANRVMVELWRAHWSLAAALVKNPLLAVDGRGAAGEATPPLSPELARELGARLAQGEYVFPIPVSFTMRMMTPARFASFVSPRCGARP